MDFTNLLVFPDDLNVFVINSGKTYHIESLNTHKDQPVISRNLLKITLSNLVFRV